MIFRSTAVIFLLFAVLSATAEPPGLTLDEAIRRAWETDPVLEPIRLSGAIVEAHEIQAGLRPRPELDLRGSAVPGSAGEWSLGVGLSRQLSRPERVEAMLAVARLGGDEVALTLREHFQRVAGAVRLRYYEAVLEQARWEAARRNLDLHREVLTGMERRRAAGEVSDVEFELLRLDLVRAELAHSQAEAAAGAALERLRYRLRADAMPSPADRLEEILGRPLPEPEGNPDDNISLAFARHRVREAAAALNLAKSSNRADWKVGAGVDFERRANDASGRLENEPRLSLSASIPWGGQTNNRGDILEKQAALRVAEARLAALRREREGDVDSALATLRRLQPALQRQRAAVSRHASVPETLLASYRRGEITSLQLAQVRQQQQALENEFLDAAGHYLTALAETENLLDLMPAQP